MNYFKQLIFGVTYLGLLTWLIWASQWVITDPWRTFDFGLGGLWGVVELSILIMITSIAYSLSVVMSKEKIIDIGVMIVGPVIAVAILGLPGLGLGIAIILGEIAAILILRQHMRNYLTWSAGLIMMPGVKALVTLLVLGLAVIYGWNIQTNVNENGFAMPDEIVDAAVQLSTGQPGESNSLLDSLNQSGLLSQLGISAEVLKGVGPEIVNNILAEKQRQSQAAIKSEVNRQLNTVLTPVLPYLGVIMGGMFLLSLMGILGLLYPLAWVILWLKFWSMEKMGMIHFEKEMREVKKLVV